MERNTPNQVIGAQMVNTTTGGAFTGAVTVYITGDGGTQTLGSVGSGLCTHKGNGYHTYTPSQAETNYNFIAFTFVGSGALTVTIPVSTLTIVRNAANQVMGAQMLNASTGAAFVGTVTVYVTGDNGTQTLGATASGVCTSEGNGYYTYLPTQAETNYDLIAFTFTGTGAIPVTVQVSTLTETQAAYLSVATSGASITARQLITRALKRIGIVGAGQTPSAEDLNDAFGHLNTMLDKFTLERLLVPCILPTTWTIDAGTAEYTVGDGGDIDMARPVFVEDVRFVDTAQNPEQEYPLGLLTDTAYRNIPQKSATSTYPRRAYYNPTFTLTGFGTLTLWPVPTSSSLEGRLYAPTALTQVPSVNTTLILQPGYRYFLQEALAEFLAPEFGVPVPEQVRENVRTSRADIKRANVRLVELATVEGRSFGGGGSYDINTDM